MYMYVYMLLAICVVQILPWPNCELDAKENSQKVIDIFALPAAS